jgi:outer membrane protein insertion porin family
MARRSLASLLALAAVALAASAPAGAALPPPLPEGVVVREVRVAGLVRMDDAAVRAAMETKPGAPLDAATVGADLHRLLDTGFFDDVTIGLDGAPEDGVLVVAVVERPTVRRVFITGNRGLAADRFTDDLAVKPGALLDRAALARTVERMRARYRAASWPFATVRTDLLPVPDAPGEVDVRLAVTESTRVRVRTVAFEGVTAFPVADLTARMTTRAGGSFDWLLDTGKLSLEELAHDADKLTGAYLDAGYLDAKVHHAVDMDPTRRDAFVRIRIEEGPRYRVGVVRVAGDTPGTTAAALEATLRLRTGDWLSRPAMGDDAGAVARHFRDDGRALTDVTTAVTPHPDDRTVDVVYEVRAGVPMRVGRIVFSGNRITRDRVMRTRLLIAEGDPWSETAVERSRAVLQALGWFESVALSSTPGSAPDLLDLHIEVKEAKTGGLETRVASTGGDNAVTIGAAYENFLGRGLSFRVEMGISPHRADWAVQLIEPRFLDTPLLLRLDGLGASYVETDFSVDTNGGAVAAGWAFGRGIDVRLRYGLRDLTLLRCGWRACALDADTVAPLFRDGLVSSLALSLEQDATDDALHPTRGLSTSFMVELADRVLGSALDFTRFRAVVRFHWPLVRGRGPGGGVGFHLYVRATLVLANGSGEVALSERLFEGGLGSLRGFATRSLGPLARLRSADPADPLALVNIGGTASVVGGAEVEFPVVARAGLRAAAFIDAGNAWGGLAGEPDVDVLPTTPLLRVAAGGGLRWYFPVGLLRLEAAFPLERDPARHESPLQILLAAGLPF